MQQKLEDGLFDDSIRLVILGFTSAIVLIGFF